MTQPQLAAAVNPGSARVATISGWENDKAVPDAKALAAIAQTLDVSADWLLFGENVRKEEPAPHQVEGRANLEPIGDPERLKLLRMLTDVQSAVARGPATSQDEVFPDELGGPPTPEDQRVPTQQRSRG